jgi:hypothetical protein
MEGLFMRITVPAHGPAPVAREPKRAVRLAARSRANVHGELPGYAYLLGGTPAKAAPD